MVCFPSRHYWCGIFQWPLRPLQHGTEYVDSSWVSSQKKPTSGALCGPILNLFLPPSASSRPQLQLDLKHSLLFFSSASPKDRLTTRHFFCTRTRPLLLQQTAKQWECWRKGSSSSTWVDGNWNTVYQLDFTRHFWATIQFSFLMQRNYFPLLLFPGNLKAWAALARTFRKTAADWDKNNYSSICLPRDTLSTYSLPLQAASL